MNKVSNHEDNYEMPEDYSEILEKYDRSKAVRGKYHEAYRSFQGKVPVKITSADGDKYVTLRTVKAEATVTSDGTLTTQLEDRVTPGKYQVTLIIEEPVTLGQEETPSENEQSHME